MNGTASLALHARLMAGFERLVWCCRSRRKRVTHQPSDNPTMTYIHVGVRVLTAPRTNAFILADFGSSSGSGSIQTMKNIIDCLRKSRKLLGSPLVVHNDLPTNNWTRVFQLLVLDQSYYGLATGRSFYEQCLPSNTLAVGFSSASLHFLSRTPCHLTDHCYFRFANATERGLFQKQANRDLCLFVEHRSRELITGGVLIVSIPSTDENGDMGFDAYFDLIYQCAQSMLNANELRHFTLPFYLRAPSECVDAELLNRCSLKLVKAEWTRLKSPIFSQFQTGEISREQLANSLTTLMRPGTEYALKQALLNHGRTRHEAEEISARFWSLYERTVRDALDTHQIYTYATYLVLKKI